MPEACSEDSRIATVLERMDRGFVGTNVTSRMIALIVLSLNIGGIVAAPVLSTTLFLFQAPAQAQSQEAVGKVAQAITVRIEGATQGSGVLVKRDGNRYTLLTAWHVVSGQRAGEELDIYTPDGQRHQLEQGSIKRLGQVDMAVLSFSSSTAYEVARVGDVKNLSSGEQVVVAGFPIGSNGQIKVNYGKLVANAAVGIDQGYQLLYRNETTAGMSGGVVLTTGGLLVGMHGRGELDNVKTQSSGVAVKTGTNQGVPISYYKQYAVGEAVMASTTQAISADDYLAQARALLGKKGSEQEVIRLANQALALRQSGDAYFYRAYAKSALGDKQEAIADYNQAIAINPQLTAAYNNRGNDKSDLGDKQGAIAEYNQAIAINPQYAIAYSNRGFAKSELGDKQEAIADYNQAIAINPQYATAYYNRGATKYDLGDKQGAIADYNQAIAINPQYAKAYSNRGFAKSELGDQQGAIADYSQAIAINPQQDADAYYSRGNAKRSLGDSQGAIADYSQAITINPKYAKAYSNRSGVRFDFGDNQGAIADANQAIAIDPQYAFAYMNRGNAKRSLGDSQGAIADYNQAIAINPKDHIVYYNRGLVKSDLGDNQGAIADYNQAITNNPKYDAAWGARGLAKSQLDDRIGACDDMRKSASLGSSVAQRLLPQMCQ